MQYWVFLVLLILITQPVRAQDDPTPLFSPDRDYFLEAAIDNPKPFLGEQMTYTLRFYYALSAREPIINLPAFSGFWRGEPVQSELIQQIGDRQYTVIERKYALEAIQAGDFSFEPTVRHNHYLQSYD